MNQYSNIFKQIAEAYREEWGKRSLEQKRISKHGICYGFDILANYHDEIGIDFLLFRFIKHEHIVQVETWGDFSFLVRGFDRSCDLYRADVCDQLADMNEDEIKEFMV